VAARLKAGDRVSIVIGIPINAPAGPNTELNLGFAGSEWIGSGKSVTPCARMH
jgi:hypothetical protein